MYICRLPPLPPTSPQSAAGCLAVLCDLGVSFGHPGATFGNPWATFGSLGVHFPILCPLWGGALEPLGHLLEKASKKVPKMTEMGTHSGHIFDAILSFFGK